jgi:3,4-dihydroxy 2-butanone 4-phosphate synthase/GTP cyclohydrolase II
MNPPCAAVYGDPADGCPVRVHSRCVYGEIFESTNCDCLWQLQESRRIIRKHGSGVLVYLDQEGRGAGLLAKAKGHQLSQEKDLDTFASYAALGFEPDSRLYDDAAALLTQLGLREVKLLTNNPAKVAALLGADIKVDQQLLTMPDPGEKARDYISAKERTGWAVTAPSGAQLVAPASLVAPEWSGPGPASCVSA